MIFRKALILMKLLHWILIALLSAAAAFCRLRLLFTWGDKHLLMRECILVLGSRSTGD